MNKEQKMVNFNKQLISPHLNKIPIKKISLKNYSAQNLNNKKRKIIQTTNKNLIHNNNNNIKNKNLNNNAYNIIKQVNPLNNLNIQEKENIPHNNNLNLLKNIIKNNSKKILSPSMSQNIIKIISPTKLQQTINNSNDINLRIKTKRIIKKIPIPIPLAIKTNNNIVKNINNNIQFFTTRTKDLSNMSPNCHTEVNNSIKSFDYKRNDKFNMKTIERGGKFNNISTTYVVISKNNNSNSKYELIQKIPKPLLTIENQNITNNKRTLIPNSSSLSIKSQILNNQNICPFNSPSTQKSIKNGGKILKMYKSQNNLFNGKRCNNLYLQTMNENNYSYVNYSNNSIYKTNASNSKNKNILLINNSRLNSPKNYNSYDNNISNDNKMRRNDSYYSYLNSSSGYNY